MYAESAAQIASRSGPYFDRWLTGYVDMVARLWGDTLAPEQLAEVAELDIAEEAQAWLVGSSTRPAT